MRKDYRRYGMRWFGALCFMCMLWLDGGILHAQQGWSLDSCKASARRHNVAVRNADLDVQAAREVKKQALTKYFPNVSGVALGYHALNPLIEYGIGDVKNAEAREMLYNWYAEEGAALGLPNSISLCEHGVTAGVTAVQPVFAGGRIVNGNKLAQVGVEAASLQYELACQQLDLQTEEYYWTIISLQEKQKTLQQVLTLLDTLYRDVTTAREAGLVVENDMLRVSIRRNEMQSNALKVANGLRLAKGALCQHIGVPYDEHLRLSDTLSAQLPAPESVYTDEQAAVGRRYETQLLEMNVTAEQLKHKMTMGEALPQLSVGVAGSYGNMVFDDYNYNGLAFVTLQVPLSAWWETAHKLKEQKLREQKAANLQQDLTGKMSLEIRQAWNSLEEAFQQLAIVEQTVDNASRNLATAMQNYQAGLVPMSELLEAQALYRQALDQQVDDRIAYQLRLTKYLQLIRAER